MSVFVCVCVLQEVWACWCELLSYLEQENAFLDQLEQKLDETDNLQGGAEELQEALDVRMKRKNKRFTLRMLGLRCWFVFSTKGRWDHIQTSREHRGQIQISSINEKTCTSLVQPHQPCSLTAGGAATH